MCEKRNTSRGESEQLALWSSDDELRVIDECVREFAARGEPTPLAVFVEHFGAKSLRQYVDKEEVALT